MFCPVTQDILMYSLIPCRVHLGNGKKQMWAEESPMISKANLMWFSFFLF